MKPGARDHRHRLLITGFELIELQKQTGGMAESFGLDRKIDNYKGTRPITLYQWDLDCLIDTIDFALKDRSEYPDPTAAEYLDLERLGDRLRQEYTSVYGDDKEAKPAATKEIVPAKAPKKTRATKSPPAAATVYQFKITLLQFKPPIWRRIQVRECTLDDLHEHIQNVMGWDNEHLYNFMIQEEEYGNPDMLDDPDAYDSTTVRLSKILPKTNIKFRFSYWYDFGDSWMHEVLFEKRVPARAEQTYPLCLDGARACPPENCGGPWGYQNLLRVLNDKTHAEHADMVEWVGELFDPEAFDPTAATNQMRS